jgi:hypothetical protein
VAKADSFIFFSQREEKKEFYLIGCLFRKTWKMEALKLKLEKLYLEVELPSADDVLKYCDVIGTEEAVDQDLLSFEWECWNEEKIENNSAPHA